MNYPLMFFALVAVLIGIKEVVGLNRKEEALKKRRETALAVQKASGEIKIPIA